MKRLRNAWTSATDEIFLNVWQEKIEQIKGSRKNSHIYKEMAAEMQKQGNAVTPASVKTKIDNLTAKYRMCKAAVGSTGGSPAVWPFYDKMHQILSGFYVNNVEEFIEECFVEISCEYSEPSFSYQPCPPSSSPTPLTSEMLSDSLPSTSASM